MKSNADPAIAAVLGLVLAVSVGAGQVRAAGLQAAPPGASYGPPGRHDAPPAPNRQQSRAAPAASQAIPEDPTAGIQGPRGSSRLAAGEQRHDEVGYASIGLSGSGGSDSGITALHRDLPPNSVVEVTALDSGRTTLVLVAGRSEMDGSAVIELSGAAVRELGLQEGGARAPVRVRLVQPSPPDRGALLSGRSASARPDAPPVLLTALRKRLPDALAPSSPPPRAVGPLRSSQPAAQAPVRGSLVVQVAALSDAANAQALAQRMGGFVRRAGRFYRVQLGPFATRGEADAARARAARAGYADARVIAAN